MAIQATVPSGVFTRQSSGLVRAVGAVDTLFYCYFQIAIGFMALIITGWHFWPGALMELATAIVIVGGVCLAIVYGLLSGVYPRSGGEYVFVSRLVHPAFGFMVGLNMTFWQAFGTGISGCYFAIFGASPFFGALGLLSGNQALTDLGAWFLTPVGIFVGATANVLFFAINLYFGIQTYFKIQRWAFIASILSFGVTFIVLALTSVLKFQMNFDAVAGAGAYQKVIADGTAAGAVPGAPFSFPATMGYFIWPAASLPFAVLSASFNGEIKNPRFSQIFGIGGAILMSGLLYIGVMFLSRNAMGDAFMFTAPAVPADKFPVPLGAGVNLFISIAGGNVLLALLTSIWVVLSVFYVGGTTLIYATRGILAFGIDGMVPDKLADVSERYHSPTSAIILVVVIAELAAAGLAFTPWVSLLTGNLSFGFGYFVIALIGMLFPFFHPETWANSAAASRIGGIPLITITGLVAALSMGYWCYLMLGDSNFGANTTFAIGLFVGIMALALVWFYVVRAIRKSQGIDVDRRYRVIPIE